MILAIFVICGLIWVGKSYMEAQSYNRITGSNVTTWDAMWVEFRVQEGAKK